MKNSPLRFTSLLWASFVILLGLPVTGHATPISADPTYSVSLFAANVGSPSGMTFNSTGDLFFTDYVGGRVIKITAPFQSGTNSFSVYASGIAFPTDLAFASDGRLLVTSSTSANSNVLQVAPDGNTSIFASGFSFPTSIVAVGDDLYVTPSGNGTIVRVDASGNVFPFLSGFSAPFGPVGLSYDGLATLYFVDHGTGRIFRTDLSGNVSFLGTLTPFGASETGVAPDGTVFVNDLLAASLYRFDSLGNITLFASGFSGKNPPLGGPGPIAFDRVGNLFVGDATSIWKFTPPPAVAFNNFLNEIANSSLPSVTKTGMTQRLSRAKDIVSDNNPNNDAAACGMLKSLINEITATQNSGELSSVEASVLKQSADTVGSIIGCP